MASKSLPEINHLRHRRIQERSKRRKSCRINSMPKFLWWVPYLYADEPAFGRLDDTAMLAVNRAMLLFLGLTD